MIWLLTAVYFILCAAILWFGFYLYGRTLTYLGRLGIVTKILGGLVAYVVFACVLVAPMFIAFNFMEEWLAAFKTSPVYMIYFMFLFILSAVPGGVYFKNYYLVNLRKLGFFAKSH